MVHLVPQIYYLIGQVQTVVTMLAAGKAQHVIGKNHCITVNNTDPTFDITRDAVHCILHNSLQFHKVSSSWVPWQPNLNWRKAHTPAKDFCDDIQQQVVDYWTAQWPDMDIGQILPASYTNEKQRMVPFQLTITQKFCTWAIVWKVMLTSF